MKRKTSEPKVSKWIPLWKNYYGKRYISPVIKKKVLLQMHRYIEKDDKWTNKDIPCKSEAEALMKIREVNQYWIAFHGYTVEER